MNFFKIFPQQADLVGENVSGFAVAMSTKLRALFLVDDLADSLKVCFHSLERVSDEGLMTKNQSAESGQIEQNSNIARSLSELKTVKIPWARENTSEQVANGFGFAPDWLRILQTAVDTHNLLYLK